MGWYGSELNENYLFKNVPLSLFRALEFQDIRAKSKGDIEAQKKIKNNDKIQELLPRTVSKKTQHLNLKPLLLILGHMFREESVKDQVLAEDLEYIRRTVPAHLQMLL